MDINTLKKHLDKLDYFSLLKLYHILDEIKNLDPQEFKMFLSFFNDNNNITYKKEDNNDI